MLAFVVAVIWLLLRGDATVLTIVVVATDSCCHINGIEFDYYSTYAHDNGFCLSYSHVKSFLTLSREAKTPATITMTTPTCNISNDQTSELQPFASSEVADQIAVTD